MENSKTEPYIWCLLAMLGELSSLRVYCSSGEEYTNLIHSLTGEQK